MSEQDNEFVAQKIKELKEIETATLERIRKDVIEYCKSKNNLSFDEQIDNAMLIYNRICYLSY